MQIDNLNNGWKKVYDVQSSKGRKGVLWKCFNFKIMALTLFMSMVGLNTMASVFAWRTIDGIRYALLSPEQTARILPNTETPYSGNMTIPSSVEYEGIIYTVTEVFEKAFQNCTGLTSISIPNSVTTIGEKAFERCTGLTSVSLGNGLSYIGEYAFYKCTSLTSITIPNSVTSIDFYAFSGSGLSSVSLGNGVNRIENYAFSDCTSLKSIVIPNNVTYLGNVFWGCTGLTSVKIGSGLTYIYEGAFSECMNLSSIEVSSENPIYDSRSNCNAIIETKTNKLHIGSCITEIPSSITEIGDDAFYGRRSLTSIEIPNTVTSIGSYAFTNCTGLTSITIPNSVTSIGYNTFYGCTGLTSVMIPCSVKNVGTGAFSYCTGLTSVVFDSCSPWIGDNVFKSCTNLTDIYYPAFACEYFSTNTQTNVFVLHPQIKIDREWTTYCATASFDVPDGIEAYVVKNYNEGVVTLQKVTTINKGQGLLLKPAEVEKFYDATLCASTPDAYESNMLKGVTTETAISPTEGEYTNFIFTKVGDAIGFYPVSAGTMPAYKAYLQIPTASLSAGSPAHIEVVVEDSEATGIEQVKTNKGSEDNWYTLTGVQTKKPMKGGVYLHNGKKVVVK